MGNLSTQVARMTTSMGYSPEECPVCMTVFDDTVQRPRSLPCGHIICTQCVNTLKQPSHVACPECRVSHVVPEGGQFPVCYTVEALLRRMRDVEAAAGASPAPNDGTGKRAAAATGQKKEAGLSRKMRSFLQQQEASVLGAITACQEVQAQLDQYQATLADWGEQQQQLEDRLLGLVEQSMSTRELLRQEESRAAAKKEEAREGEQQLHAALEALRASAAEQEARLAVAEVLRCTFEVKEVLEECRESFPDSETTTNARKVKDASNAALKAFQAVQTAVETRPSATREEPLPQSDPGCITVNRLWAIQTPSLKAKDLRSPTQPVRRLLEAGRVFGVHQVMGRRRHARISFEAGRLYLHTLELEQLPPGAKALEVSQLVPLSPPCIVFLDLSWPGSMLQRVYVRLSPDTPLGRQAMLLCTGQRGASYAGTNLFEVGNQGQPGECVCGGNYEIYRKRGTALLRDLDAVKYPSTGKAGAVWRWKCGDPEYGTVFGITTKDCQDGRAYKYVFGKVVQGLDILVAAAQHIPITEVIVQDCGVVL